MTSLSYFLNIGNQLYNRALNNIDPRILQSYTPDYLSNTAVNNPYYQYGSQDLIPGPWYSQQQIPLSSLLTKYPMYGALYEIGVRGAEEQYQNIELRVQKRWAQGFKLPVRLCLHQREVADQQFQRRCTVQQYAAVADQQLASPSHHGSRDG